METEEKNQRPTAPTIERPTCSAVLLYGNGSNSRQSLDDANDTITHSHHRCIRGSTARNIEIDWREVDPYFSELSDCASFWTLINFTCDVIYSGLFVLFFIMGQDVESLFFEGLLNHINPILIYLIMSLVINYGALRSLRCGRERCFLIFSITKALLFPITISLLLYLLLCDVQDYFEKFWLSFVVIVSCYNLTAAIGLWSMFICNKYILVNEAAQKRIRKQANQQRSVNNETNFRCRCVKTSNPAAPSNFSSSQCGPSSRTCSAQFRKVGDSSCANNTKHQSNSITSNFLQSVKTTNNRTSLQSNVTFKEVRAHGSQQTSSSSRANAKRNSVDDDVLSFGEDDEVLQISTVHKVMQEIRLLDTANSKRSTTDHDLSDDGDSL